MNVLHITILSFLIIAFTENTSTLDSKNNLYMIETCELDDQDPFSEQSKPILEKPISHKKKALIYV